MRRSVAKQMIQRRAVVWKRVGETPLQALESFRASDPALQGISMTYAGRLDPMAEGKLLLLIGDECAKRRTYDGLDKEYEFEAIFGIGSDTGDVLGIPEQGGSVPSLTDAMIRDAASVLVGPHVLPYPTFSSKPVEGKPLFQHALDGTLRSITIPNASVRVHRLVFLGTRRESVRAVAEAAIAKVNLLAAAVDPARPGSDFRKADILARWDGLRMPASADAPLTVASFRAVVSSGTYVRALVTRLAEMLGTKGLALSIRRTVIGRYRSIGPFGFWTRRY